METLKRKFNIGIGKETSRGTAVAPVYWLKPLSEDINDKIEVIASERAVGVIEDSEDQEISKKLSGGTVAGEVFDRSFGLIRDILLLVPDLDSMLLSTGEKLYFTTIENYHTYNFLKIEFNKKVFKAGTIAELPISILNPTGKPIALESDSMGVKIATVFYQKGEIVFYEEVQDITGVRIDENYQTRIKIKVPDQAGEYYFRVVLRSGWLPPGLNSRIQKITIND